MPNNRGRTGTSAIADTRRAEIIGDLNGVLVHLIDISLSAKQAHWNVEGPNFQGLHVLFDEITDVVRAHADIHAERVRALGGTSHGTVEDVSRGTSFGDFPTDERNWQTLTGAVHDRLTAMSGRLYELIKSTEDDLTTQDLYIATQHEVDKYAWMLEAHLR
jgi:starvation-inducible DNA-binding protein